MIVRAPCGAIVWASVVALVMSTGCIRPWFARRAPAARAADEAPVVTGAPVRIGVESDGRSSLDLDPLADALAKRLRRPVRITPLTSSALEAGLQDGRIQFGLLPAGQPQDGTRHTGVPVAVGLGASQLRRGLIVAAASSSVLTLSDLVGQRFAFGPAGDPVFDHGAVEAIERAGVPVDSLKKEMIPIPGGRQFHESTRDAARTIVYEFGTYVGVIDEAEYLAMSETGGRFLPGVFTFSKDQFRILGRTETIRSAAVARWRFVAATQTDAALVHAVRSFLLSVADSHPSALAALGITRFDSVGVSGDDVDGRFVEQGVGR